MANTCNPSTVGVEEGGWLSLRPVWATKPNQPNNKVNPAPNKTGKQGVIGNKNWSWNKCRMNNHKPLWDPKTPPRRLLAVQPFVLIIVLSVDKTQWPRIHREGRVCRAHSFRGTRAHMAGKLDNKQQTWQLQQKLRTHLLNLKHQEGRLN